MRTIVCIVLSTALCYAQVQKPYSDLPERIGNFSIEALYHTSKTLQNGQNIIMSPFTVWNALAAIAEGAVGNTKNEINYAIRWNRKDNIANEFKQLTRLLRANTNAVKLSKINTILVNQNSLLSQEYHDVAKAEYEVNAISLKFSDSALIASVLNKVISNFTGGLINKIVEAEYFQNTNMVLLSAIHFSGLWSVPFNASATRKVPFYDSNGEKIGYVNMMYKKFTYPVTNFRQLQARVLELPYGDGNKVSMFMLLPNPGVSVEDMFSNLQNMYLETFFEEMRISKEEYPDDEVDCFIPRFKAETALDLANILKTSFGVKDLFDSDKSRLSLLARTPLYVSKMVHKAQIEVTEEGTKAAAVTVAEFKSRSGAISFNANRPFAYLIVEKVTNTILLGGLYRQPLLY